MDVVLTLRWILRYSWDFQLPAGSWINKSGDWEGRIDVGLGVINLEQVGRRQPRQDITRINSTGSFCLPPSDLNGSFLTRLLPCYSSLTPLFF